MFKLRLSQEKKYWGNVIIWFSFFTKSLVNLSLFFIYYFLNLLFISFIFLLWISSYAFKKRQFPAAMLLYFDLNKTNNFKIILYHIKKYL